MSNLLWRFKSKKARWLEVLYTESMVRNWPLVLVLVIGALAVWLASNLVGIRNDLRQRASEGDLGDSGAIPQIVANKELDPGEGEVSGNICAYGTKQIAGKVVFYEPNKKEIYVVTRSENDSSYTATVPAGSYLSFYFPEGGWPKMAYNQYARCGMDVKLCHDHGMVLIKVEAGKSYGQVNVCDPQYKKEGLEKLFI